MDAADFALIEQERELDRAMSNRQSAASLPSAAKCEHCGDEIPTLRRESLPGVQTCVDCQGLVERGVL